jgi:fructoselysine-6-P-deglycase FrlB-like protein
VNSIEAYENDINSQLKFLESFRPCKSITKFNQHSTIFCGSGDSLASAMLAESHSEFRVKAADPLDLLKNKPILKNKNIYIVSISGRTISNIKIAKMAKKSVAITSFPHNPLGKNCNQVIQLKSPHSDIITSGSISFLESALVCISLVKSYRIKDPHKLFFEAKNQSKKVHLKGKVFFLGNLHTYPIALYAAAKLYEILGSDAYYERLEQFSHMELFSAKPGDTVIIFEPKNPHISKLIKNLKKVGLNTIHPQCPAADEISQFLFYTFFSQLISLLIAKKNGKKECHFIIAKKLRQVSDNMIY